MDFAERSSKGSLRVRKTPIVLLSTSHCHSLPALFWCRLPAAYTYTDEFSSSFVALLI